MKTQQQKQKRIFILADDLTGAADAANYFRTETQHVRVGFSSRMPWDLGLDSTVVQVYDSETRASSVEQAKVSIYSAARELFHPDAASFHIYKKVDSTLRGNMGAEIEAALDGLNRQHAILVPTFPGAYRSVRDGTLYIKGTPLSETEFARDPRNPVHHSKIADLVHETTNLPVEEVPLAVVRNGADALIRVIENLPARRSIIVIDAESEADLIIVAKAIAEDGNILPCGSAGLARSLATFWNQGSTELDKHQPIELAPSPCDKVLVMAGSANPKTHRQLDVLVDELDVPCVTVSPKQLADARNVEASNGELHLDFRTKRIMALTLSDERVGIKEDLGEQFVAVLAKIAKTWCEQQNHSKIGIIATGGDTALALCKALSTHAIWPQGEIASGMPWSTVKTGNSQLILISKAGGFGDENTLLHAVKSLIDTNE